MSRLALKKSGLILVMSTLLVCFNNCGQPLTAIEVPQSQSASSQSSSILQHPSDVSVMLGQSASFSVVVADDDNVSYQWAKDGINIPGANLSNLNISSVTLAHAGDYVVIITNAAGSISSEAAKLTVTPLGPVVVAPSITSQPVSQSVITGANVSFSVAASGSAPMTYQWTKGGANIAGATASTYSLASVQASNAGSFAVRIMNSAGSVTSQAATLTVSAPPVTLVAPSISTQPVSKTVNQGAAVSFSVAASGSATLAYQWTKGGVNISGATGNTYSIAAAQSADAGSFAVRIANSVGSVTSQAATLTVNPPPLVAPSITSQPVAKIVTVGSSATFNVAASGSATLTYQWTKGGSNISGATSATYTIASVQLVDAGSFAVRVTNSAGSVTSSAATLTVNAAPVATGFPGPTNTGYKNAPGYTGSLTTFSGTITSNTTYRFMKFAGGLYIRPGITNVTFYGCLFASNSVDNANVTVGDYNDSTTNNIIFDYSSFEPNAGTTSPVPYNKGYQYGINQRSSAQITIDHSDFWGWGNGIQFGFSTQARPFVVKNTWFHDAREDGGIDHTDAILSNEGGPSYMVFDNNTIVSKGNTQGLALQTESRGYDHVTITNNYFSGFAYTVAIGENLKSTNITFTGNTFGTDIKPVFGVLYSDSDFGGTSTNVWKCNKWKVVAGSYYSPASDNGKFWVPGGVSASDYMGNTVCP